MYSNNRYYNNSINGGGRPRKSKLWLMLSGLVVFLLGGWGLITSFLLSSSVIEGLPSHESSTSWARISGLFDDAAWHSAIASLENYVIPSDRENLLLYKTIYVDGQKLNDTDQAHWTNFGTLNYIYQVPTGKHTYLVDVGREVPVSQFVVLITCKECQYATGFLPDSPIVPGSQSGQITQTLTTPDQVAHYFSPITTTTTITATATVGSNSLAQGGQSHSNFAVQAQQFSAITTTTTTTSPTVTATTTPITTTLGHNSGGTIDPKHPFNVPDPAASDRQAQVVVDGTDANPLAPHGARYFLVEINNSTPDCYLAQMLAYPIGTHSNVFWASQPTFDVRYQNVYDKPIANALGVTKTYPTGVDPLAQRLIHSQSLTPTFSYYSPMVDNNQQSYLTVYPVIGASDGTGPHAGDGSCLDANAGYYPIYVEWTLPSEAIGKLDEVDLDWLANYVGATAPFGGNSQAGASAVRQPTFAKEWSLYLLDNTNSAQASIIKGLFNPSSSVSQMPSQAGLQPYLFKRYGAAITNNNQSDSGSLGLPLQGDKHNTVIIEFQTSSYRAPHPPSVFFPDPTPTPGPGQTPTPTPAPGQPTPTPTGTYRDLCDPANASYITPANRPQPPSVWPNELAGLPPDWLSVAEVTGFERKPPTPQIWPINAPIEFSTGMANVASGGAFDIRFGTCSADTIEGIIAKYPWRGITPGGYPAGDPPSPNKLTGLGSFFVQMGEEYGLNPCYAVGQAMKETSLGTSGYTVYDASTARWGYNLYGMTGTGWLPGLCIPGFNGRFCGYRSWQDSIRDWFALISQAYVQGQASFLQHNGTGKGQLACPCTTIERILPWYAPYSENDTDLYIQQFEGWITEWHATAPVVAAWQVSAGTNGMSAIPQISQLDASQYLSSAQYYAWKEITCGVTSATMIIDSFGYNLRIGDLLQVAIDQGSIGFDGTRNFNYLVSDEIRSHGINLNVKTFTAGNADAYFTIFKELTANGVPVIANILDSVHTGGHFFVVTGWDAATNSFIINDPYGNLAPLAGNPRGIVQKWPATTLAYSLRIGLPAIIVTKAGSDSQQAALPALLTTKKGGNNKGNNIGNGFDNNAILGYEKQANNLNNY